MTEAQANKDHTLMAAGCGCGLLFVAFVVYFVFFGVSLPLSSSIKRGFEGA